MINLLNKLTNFLSITIFLSLDTIKVAGIDELSNSFGELVT